MLFRYAILCAAIYYACLHECSGQSSTENQSVLIVAGRRISLPLKISVILDIYCRAGLTSPICPSGSSSYYGPGYYAYVTILLAQKAINENPELWPFHNMTISLLNTQGYFTHSIKNIIAESKANDTLAIFGLENSCDVEAMVASSSKKLLVSHYCTATKQYPTLVQLQGQFSKMADAAISFIQANGWDRVVLIFFYDDGAPEMLDLRKRLNNLLLENNVKIVKSCSLYVMRSDNGMLLAGNYSPQWKGTLTFLNIIQETYLLTRVYVLLSVEPMATDAKWFLDIMGRIGLLQTGEYAMLNLYSRSVLNKYNGTVGTGQIFLTTAGSNTIKPSPLREPLAEELFNNHRSAVMFTETMPPDSIAWLQYRANMLRFSDQTLPCPPICNMTKFVFSFWTIPPYSARLFEAIVYYARLVSRLIKENQTDIMDGYSMKQYFYGLRFPETTAGVSIALDGFAAAEEDITVSTATYSPDGRPGVYPIGAFRSTTQGNEKKLYLQLNQNASFNWVNGVAPPPGPKCGFRGEACPMRIQMQTWLIALFAVVAVTLLIAFSVYYWRQKQKEKLLKQAIWKILLKDLVLHDVDNQFESTRSVGSGTSASMGSAGTLRMHRSRSSLKELERGTEANLDDDNQNADDKTPLTNPAQRGPKGRLRLRRRNAGRDEQWWNIGSFVTALHKGHLVGLKRVYKKSAALNDDIKKELSTVVSLSHDNINKLIGVVYEPAAILLVAEYCQKGSLKDMLENDEIKLDRIFLAAIVFDILNGVQYLQSTSLRCHGHLKSSNCLIDSKWVLRVSEFGLFQFLEGEDKPISQEEKCRKSLWTAPELLRADYEMQQGTQQADVYAFGIILHEIFGRQGPFGDTLLDPIESIQRIKFPRADEPLLRPDMRAVIEAPNIVRSVMQQCWDEDQFNRPKISDLQTTLQPLKEGLSENMIDNIMSMIEKYNTNLEGLVAERTAELEMEKRKADALLSAMLPKQVAELLKQGQAVEPEYFDGVTIYFSDIVGFANIIHEYTPYQVINFLHHVYATFDSLTTNFDVYKVETIGDAYMVVSGLPIRNGDNHAGEIASMALRFLKEAKERKFKTLSGDIVQLRVGIHSGPCVAGVVGLKMPRYCLFGDTVNTASRMESNGQALKIHCSGECNSNLQLLGGYETVERGYVEMKGKGKKLTYWLVGEDPTCRQNRIGKK